MHLLELMNSNFNTYIHELFAQTSVKLEISYYLPDMRSCREHLGNKKIEETCLPYLSPTGRKTYKKDTT